MNAAELREMSDEQMTAELNQARASLFHLRVKAQTDTVNAPREIRRNRRLIARIQTILRERKSASPAQPAVNDLAES